MVRERCKSTMLMHGKEQDQCFILYHGNMAIVTFSLCDRGGCPQIRKKNSRQEDSRRDCSATTGLLPHSASRIVNRLKSTRLGNTSGGDWQVLGKIKLWRSAIRHSYCIPLPGSASVISGNFELSSFIGQMASTAFLQIRNSLISSNHSLV